MLLIETFFFFLLKGTMSLAVAAESAPEGKRVKFQALIEELCAGDYEVQDLLDKGELWSGLRVSEGRQLQSGLPWDLPLGQRRSL